MKKRTSSPLLLLFLFATMVGCSNGSGSGSGSVTPPVSPPPPPPPPPALPGDECSDAITAVLGNNPVDTTEMTTSANLPDNQLCGGTFLGDFNQDAWYRFIPTTTGSITISTCGTVDFDTDLAVYTGSCGALSQIACNGDAPGCAELSSMISAVPVVAGNEYLIRLGGWDGFSAGIGTMNIAFGGGGGVELCNNGVDDDGDGWIDCFDTDCIGNPACGGGGGGVGTGDECSDAITAVLGNNPVDTTAMTTSANLPDNQLCVGTFLGDFNQDAWYRFIPTTTGSITISTCGTVDFDTDLAVYTGSCGALSQIACNGDAPGCADFSSQINNVPVTAGVEYLIRLGGWDGISAGIGTMNIAFGGGGGGGGGGGAGMIAFMSDRDIGDHDIYKMASDGSQLTQLTSSPGWEWSPSWSPDGAKIAYSGWGDGYDIIVMNSDGSAPINLTTGYWATGGFWAWDENPSWSPDGTQIAFLSDRLSAVSGFGYDLFVMNADGTNQTLLLENPLSAEDWIWMGGPARWSPDGEKILFKTYSTVDDLSGKIWVVNSDGSNPQVLLDFPDADEGAAAWSPDGTKIAFSSDIGGDNDLYVMNADGTNVQALTDNNSDDGSASWSPDGAQIAFMSDRDGDWEIYVMNSDGSYQQNITNSPASDDGNPGWGP